MRNKLLFAILGILVMLVAGSCKKWLDVQPRTKIKSQDLLRTEQGYKDALIGCYTLMKSEALYGRELTFGFVDVIAQQYDTYNNATYGNVSRWNYTTVASVRSEIDNIWGGMYNVLANVNNILDNIDKDKSIFTEGNYELIKGEALGIRAFIHLDLLRLFGSTDLTKSAIPYIATLSTNVVPRSTGDQVVSNILQDIQSASTYLAADPIIKGNKYVYSANDFINNRHQRINYYALKAIAARAYLWKGDKVNALASAMEIISNADRIFPWIQTSNISAPNDKDKDFTFSTENLFALNIYDLKAISNTWLYAALPTTQLFRSSFYYEQMFEKTSVGANDYRLLFTSRVSSGNYTIYKFYQPDNFTSSYAAMMPLIRRSEMNYIAAECNVGVDNQKAIDYLNQVRANRGITTPLSATLTDAAIQAEILKEYRKEFQGEGQLFSYCKRTKQAKFPTSSVALSDVQYVLPLPQNEIEFGK